MLSRRAALVVGAAAGSVLPAAARANVSLWFDPTQLPSYSGRLERWVGNPSGSVDRGLFREGPQFIFAASEAEALMQAIQPGAPISVWGIRARQAPVILMLAWGRSDTDPASFIERPAWFAANEPGREAFEIQGRVLAPLLTPRGEGMGVILAEGGAIRLPVAAHRTMESLLRPGEPIAARGRGSRRAGLVALDAAAIGRDMDNLQPVDAR